MGRLTFSPRFSDWILALYLLLQALAIRDIPANNHNTRQNTGRQRDTVPGLPPPPPSWCQSPALSLSTTPLTSLGCSTARLTLCTEAFCGRQNPGAWTLLEIQQLRLCLLSAGGPGSIPGLGTRSHMLQLRVLIAPLEDPACHNEDLEQPNKENKMT